MIPSMKIAFVFDQIHPDELNSAGQIKSDSRTVSLFKYLTGVLQQQTKCETMMFIAAPKPGKATAKELKDFAEHIQKALNDFGPTHIIILGKSAIYSISDWLPNDFPRTLRYNRLWGKVFSGNLGSGGAGSKRADIVFCPSATMVWAGKQQDGGYLYLRTIQENIIGAVLPSTSISQTVSVYIDDRGKLYDLIGPRLSGSKLKRIINNETCAVDTETTGLNIISDKIRTIQFSFKDGESYVCIYEILQPDGWSELLQSITNAGWKLVLQNGKYDYKILKSNGVQLPRYYEELSIAHVLVDEREGTHNLDFIGQQILGAGKTEITKDHLVNGPIDESFIQYAGTDTDITRQAFNVLYPAVKDKPIYSTLIKAATHLADGEHYGIKLDKDKLEDLISQADYKLAEYTQLFEDIGLNPSSPKQVKEHLGLEGKADKNMLETLDTELANAIVDYRGLIKVKNTYLLRLQASANVDGRFHPDIRLAGPVTGRTSSGSGAAPDDMLWLPINSQNIPRPAQGQQFKYLSEELRSQLRHLFIADEGRVMLGMDLAAAEMRMAANACLDPVMIDDLNRKVDTHSLLTIMAYNLPYEIDLDNPDEWVRKVKKDHEFQRQSTKNATFAVLYGGGLQAIAAQAKCDVETAKLLRNTIYERYPGLQTWIDGIHNAVRSRGFVTTRYGRRRIFPYNTGVFDRQQQQSMLREAQNYVIQSEASDYCLMGLNKFMDNIPTYFKPVHVQNMVHDALYFSVAEEDAEEAKSLLVEMVQTADNLPAILYADAKYSTNWGDL